MNNIIFVTGTDTDVGKTMIASALTAALVKRGHRVAVFKPVETGCILNEHAEAVPTGENPGTGADVCDGDAIDPKAAASLNRLRELAGTPPSIIYARAPQNSLIPRDAEQLRRFSNCDQKLTEVNLYRYAPPVAPAAAAAVSERPIRKNRIIEHAKMLSAAADYVIIEGAGGLMVPLGDGLLMIDVIEALGCKTLLVGKSALGTINHTLLSLEALKKRKIPVCGVVLNRQEKTPNVDEAINPHQIELFEGDIVRGVFPYIGKEKAADTACLAQRFESHVDLSAILK